MSLRALRVRGPFRGTSGYDRHTRAFVRGLAAAGVAIQLEALDEWGSPEIPLAVRDPWFESLAKPIGARVTLHSCVPPSVRPDPGCINVNYTMFEAIPIPAPWAEAADHVDLVVVPTASSLEAWLAAGVDASRVRVSPLGVDLPAAGTPPAAPLRLVADDGEVLSERHTRFLQVAELGPRKNLEGLIGAWLRATTAADDAVLILKLSSPDPLRFERFWARVRIQTMAAGRRLEDAAPIHVLREVLPDTDMPRLYATATHYLSLSFGEGWDQPMSEAAVAGLRLIAPDHSGYRAYLDASIARPIPSRRAATSWPEDDAWSAALFAGREWWAPDEDEAVLAIREAIDGREPPRGDPRERMRAFSWEAATASLLGVLEELNAATSAAGGG